MPTYEYICTGCGHEFELLQRITDPPRKRCPRCGKKVERKIGAGAGIIFKGSGFYATDYRSEDYKAKAKAETSGAAGGGDGTGAGGNGKPSGDRTAAGGSGESGAGGGKGDPASGREGAAKKGKDKAAGSSVGTKPAQRK